MKDLMNRLGREQNPFLFIIDYGMKVPIVVPLDKLRDDILFDLDGFTNLTEKIPSAGNFRFESFPPPYEEYKTAFENIQRHQTAGNSYLANLTFPSRIETDLPMKEIFLLGKAKYKLLYRDRFTVFSPETFVRIKDGKISTCPMKGTIDASLPDAERTILNDEKESAEHLTIVDLMRNDLSRVAKDVRVEDYRWVSRVSSRGKELLQVSSTITGQLAPGYGQRIGDILFDLLPAGSVTGAPKPKTVEIIRETERYDRGYYTGVFGVFDGKNMDSSVMIRFIENIDGVFYYKSGGGVTVYSDPVKEYREMVDKIYVPIV